MQKYAGGCDKYYKFGAEKKNNATKLANVNYFNVRNRARTGKLETVLTFVARDP